MIEGIIIIIIIIIIITITTVFTHTFVCLASVLYVSCLLSVVICVQNCPMWIH